MTGFHMISFSRNLMYTGPLKNDVSRVEGAGEGGEPKLVTKSDIGRRGYIKIVTPSPKKLCISFYFSLVFGQRGSG